MILALKASGVSISTMSGATCSRFQSRTVLGKNDIFLVSIQEDGIWNDLLCACLVFRPGGIRLFSLLTATNCIQHYNFCIELKTMFFYSICFVSNIDLTH